MCIPFQLPSDTSSGSCLPSFLSTLAHFPKWRLSFTCHRIAFQMILTSYTTFEEQNIPYPQKSSQNNENINKGLQLLKNSFNQHVCLLPCKLREHIPLLMDPINSPLPYLDWSPNPLEYTLQQLVLRSFNNVKGWKIN